MPFPCPRCRQPTETRFYGPCDSCRGELRASMTGAARELSASAYEPAMHVTPNAVALKDD